MKVKPRSVFVENLKPSKNSPCVGLCSTTYGDPLCRGCLRSLDQVLNWTGLSNQDKENFLKLSSSEVEYICRQYFVIHHSDIFVKDILKNYHLFYHSAERLPNPYYIFFQMLQLYPEDLQKKYSHYCEVLNPNFSAKQLALEVFEHMKDARESQIQDN